MLLLVFIFIHTDNIIAQTYTNFYLNNIGSFNFVKNGNKFNIEALNQKYRSNYIDSPNFLFGNYSSLSDTNYNKLLYTSENRVYSKGNKLVSNSDILFGETNAFDTLGFIIKYKTGINTVRHLYIKRPGNINQYLLFYVNPLNNLLNYCLIQYNVVLNTYTMVDKNIELDKFFTYSFDITHHKNGKDLWIVRTSKNNGYVASLITENEIGKINTFSSLGSDDVSRTLDYYNLYYLNYTKISPDGKYLAFVTNSDLLLKDPNNKPKSPKFNPTIANFDNNTGKVSNKVLLEYYYDELDYDILNSVVDIEFSAKSKSFFIVNHEYIYKYNYDEVKRELIKEINKFDFVKSINTIYLTSFLGPDKNIYFISTNDQFEIGSQIGIKNYDLFTIKDDYNYKQTNKTNKSILTGITYRFTNNLYYPFEVMTSQFYEVETELTKKVCFGSEFFLTANVLRELTDTIYKWTGPNNFISYEQNPKLIINNKGMEGLYTVEVYDKNQTKYFTGFTTLRIDDVPYFNIIKDKYYICNNSNIKLTIKEVFPGSYRYLWSNGDTLKSIDVDKKGEYTLTVSNEFECSTTQTITIENATPPEFDVLKIGEECGSSAVKLRCDRDFPTTFTYLWNTGATTAEISATINGVYTLTVTDTNGCKTSKSVTVTFGQKPIASISATGPTTFCEGGKVELRASGGINSNDLFFKWSSGETVPNITVTKSGVYRVVITHKFSNCVDSAEIEIKVNANLECNIVQNNMLCKGREITLTAEPQGIEYTYLWSTGATTSSIIISQGGRYSVEISLDDFCKSSSVIDVIEFTPEEFEITATGKLCVGEIVTLSTNKDFASYEWSTGENTKEIAVTNSGVYSVTAIDLNGCVSVNNIEIIFVNPKEYNLDFTNYDFGDVEIGAEKRVKFNIPGEVEMQIKGDFTYDMETNEMVFKPTDEKSYSGEIVVDFGGDCDTTATILLVGRGVNSLRYKAKVIAPTIDTEAGLEDVELPFTFNISRDDLMYPFILTYKMTFEINLDVYLPNFTTTIINNKRVVELTGTTNIIKGENIIATILGKTFLSEFIDNPINVIDFEHNIPKTDVEQIDGNIKIVGVCTQNLRIIQFRHLTKLNITPNPATDNILVSVSTAEKGTHRLFLTSITGSKKELLTFIVGDDIFEQTFDINFRYFSDGTYILELQTPNQSLTEKVLIIR